jgi:hypothetical protein
MFTLIIINLSYNNVHTYNQLYLSLVKKKKKVFNNNNNILHSCVYMCIYVYIYIYIYIPPSYR